MIILGMMGNGKARSIDDLIVDHVRCVGISIHVYDTHVHVLSTYPEQWATLKSSMAIATPTTTPSVVYRLLPFNEEFCAMWHSYEHNY